MLLFYYCFIFYIFYILLFKFRSFFFLAPLLLFYHQTLSKVYLNYFPYQTWFFHKTFAHYYYGKQKFKIDSYISL